MKNRDYCRLIRGLDLFIHQPLIKLIRMRTTKKMVLVEIGVGSGLFITKLAKNLPSNIQIIGEDISEENIALASQRAKKMGMNIKFCLGTNDTLPFKNNSIDLVVSCLSLHHWKEPAAILKEIIRILRHRGKTYICDFYQDSFFGKFLDRSQIIHLLYGKLAAQVFHKSRKVSFTLGAIREQLIPRAGIQRYTLRIGPNPITFILRIDKP